MTTLTLEQQRTLDELTRGREPADFVQTWFGVSRQDLRARLASMAGVKNGVERRWLARIARNPMDATFEFLSAAALAFFLAERESNPRIRTYIDAFYYIATCASVGYADIFAATQTGRAIAGLVMTVGPALTNRALDQPQV